MNIQVVEMATATVCNPIAYPAGYETGSFYCFNTTWSEQDAATYSHCQGNGYSPNAVQSPPMTFVKVRGLFSDCRRDQYY